MKNKQKLFASTLTAAMVATAIAPVASAEETLETSNTFTDMDEVSSWAKESVTYLKDNKIVEGYNNLFNAKTELTRGEAAKIIALSLGLTPVETTTDSKFSDLAGHWSEEYVNALVNSTDYANVINGYVDGTFKPTQVITREELAKMVVVAFDLKLDETKEVSFKDNKGWAKNYIEVLASNGIVNGTGNNTFSPKAVVTRESAAVFIHRTKVEEIRLDVTEKAPTELTLVDATVNGNDFVTFENNTFTMIKDHSLTSITFEMNEEVAPLETELKVNIVKGEDKVAYGSLSVVEGKLVVTPAENNGKAGLVGEFTFEVEGKETIKSTSGLVLGEDFELPKLKVVENNDLTIADAKVEGAAKYDVKANKFTITQDESITSITFDMNETVEALTKDLTVTIVKAEGSAPVAYGTLNVDENGDLVVTPSTNNGTAGLVGTFTFEVEGKELIKSLDGSVLAENFALPTLVVEETPAEDETTEDATTPGSEDTTAPVTEDETPKN